MNQMDNKEYEKYVEKMSPNSPMVTNMLKAFLIGGLICCIGQAIGAGWEAVGRSEEDSAAATSVPLIFLGAFLTGVGLYDDIAKFAGAGTLVPITGFSNSVVAPAIEFKAEGFVTGMASKMFVISGPVIVFGALAAAIYGLILCII